MSNRAGTLYVVATPIGNLEDISLRAIAILKAVDTIAAEDTRHSGVLLSKYNIRTSLTSLHDHNEGVKAEKLLDKLRSGEDLALISDAGTPLVSDPGYILIREARASGIKVSPVPGSCALIAALSVAGVPVDRFIFEGFLPAKSSARSELLKQFLNEPRTVIFYESSHRIYKCLSDMCTVLGEERKVVLARELTKMYETVHESSVAGMLEFLAGDENQQKGEFVIILQGVSPQEPTLVALKDCLLILMEDLPIKQAAKLAAKITGSKRNTAYKFALELSKELPEKSAKPGE